MALQSHVELSGGMEDFQDKSILLLARSIEKSYHISRSCATGKCSVWHAKEC